MVDKYELSKFFEQIKPIPNLPKLFKLIPRPYLFFNFAAQRAVTLGVLIVLVLPVELAGTKMYIRTYRLTVKNRNPT